jgi:hypothetical protein
MPLGNAAERGMKLISVIEDKPLLPRLAEPRQFKLGAARLEAIIAITVPLARHSLVDSSGDGMINAFRQPMRF